jgi:hypothetical protein
MKLHIIRLMTIFGVALVILPNNVDAFGFGKFFKKAAHTVTHSPAFKQISHQAVQIGRQAVVSQASSMLGPVGGEIAGNMFDSAADHMHQAHHHQAKAEHHEQQAHAARGRGNHEEAAHHDKAAKFHRDMEAHHRKGHEIAKGHYEGHSGSNFDDDHERHVSPHLKKHAPDYDDDDY